MWFLFQVLLALQDKTESCFLGAALVGTCSQMFINLAPIHLAEKVVLASGVKQ